jgi:dodecin
LLALRSDNQYISFFFHIKTIKKMVLKVIEILASSTKSWEDAANNAVKEASKSVRGIRSININNQSAIVEDGKISEFRINCKISFEIER